ncbi:LysR family transcriptional regulator [Pelagibaculum spongiae]|uniref:LysR family transcriptional regulator n=1 Tax=Pelagibaculum spongiae TaxID=2080658 RepID=UPI002102509E|nr:LysR family transcriptional regulator [Pelagibaculum spongiae]
MLLEDLQVILKVAEFRSITAAAANLDMHITTASAAVKRVEQSLGVELFVRTTRHLRLSHVGERYLPNCQQALQMLEQAQQNVKEDLDVVDGELRVALSSDLGRNLIIPWMDQFMDDYPSLSLRTHVSDSNIDFYRDSVDIALRYGSPKHPHDLASHNGLFYQLHDIINNVWKFTKDGIEYKIKMNGNRASNDGDLVRR